MTAAVGASGVGPQDGAAGAPRAEWPWGTVVQRKASDLDWVLESRAGIGANLPVDFAGRKHRCVEKNRKERGGFAGQAARAQFWVRSLGLEHMAAS